MRASRIILLVVALLAGGLAAFLATRGDAPTVQVVEGPTQIIEEQKTRILVAKAPIGIGERLSPETVEWQDWPELAVRPEYVSIVAMPDAIETISGSVARFEFFPGEPIMERKLVRSDQGYLSAVLGQGMRGVSVAVTGISAAGGYIVPNDRVDVISTRPSTSGLVSETILSNVRVLAVDRRLGEAGTTGAGADPADPTANVFLEDAIATLELTPVQAEIVVNAARVGQLSLALRSIVDFASRPESVQQQTSRAIRVIKYGVDQSVMSTRAPTPEAVASAEPASDAPAAAPAPEAPPVL
jgi:pilus assembly protein CpaB